MGTTTTRRRLAGAYAEDSAGIKFDVVIYAEDAAAAAYVMEVSKTWHARASTIVKEAVTESLSAKYAAWRIASMTIDVVVSDVSLTPSPTPSPTPVPTPASSMGGAVAGGVFGAIAAVAAIWWYKKKNTKN